MSQIFILAMRFATGAMRHYTHICRQLLEWCCPKMLHQRPSRPLQSLREIDLTHHPFLSPKTNDVALSMQYSHVKRNCKLPHTICHAIRPADTTGLTPSSPPSAVTLCRTPRSLPQSSPGRDCPSTLRDISVLRRTLQSQ